MSDHVIRLSGFLVMGFFAMTIAQLVEAAYLGMVGAGLMRSIGIPALGIEGAAWAFVLARGASFCMTAWWFIAKEKLLRLSIKGIGQSTKDILHVGVPVGATKLINPLSAAATTRILAEFGTPIVAGFGVATRIDAVVSKRR